MSTTEVVVDWFGYSLPSIYTNGGDAMAPAGVQWVGQVQKNPLFGNTASPLSPYYFIGMFVESALEGDTPTATYHLCGWSYQFPNGQLNTATGYEYQTLGAINNTITPGTTITQLTLASPISFALPEPQTPIILAPAENFTFITLRTTAACPKGTTTIPVVAQVAPTTYEPGCAVYAPKSLAFTDLGIVNLVDASTNTPLSGAITGIAIVPVAASGSLPMLAGNAGPAHEIVVFVWEQGNAPADLPAYTLDPTNPGAGLTQWYCPGWQFNYEPYNSEYDSIIFPSVGYPGALYPPTNTTTMLPIVSAIGPEGPGPNILGNSTEMYVYGPASAGTAYWTIGIQGNGPTGPTPIYFYHYYSNYALNKQCLVFTQYPFTEVFASADLADDVTSHNILCGSANTSETNQSFFVYVPTAKGQYGFYELLSGGGWGLVPDFVLDIQKGYVMASGIGEPQFSGCMAVGYSPSQGGVAVADNQDYSTVYKPWQWLFIEAPATGEVTDGNLATGLFVDPVGVVDNPAATPIFLDSGPWAGQPIPAISIAEYKVSVQEPPISPPDPAGTRATWFRSIAYIPYNQAVLKQLAALRMFQRSDSFGVRQFQLSGSANSPLSVRSQSAGATHV